MFRVGSVVPRRINASQSTASQTLAGDLYNPVIQYTENVLSADFIDAYLSLASNILRILPNDKRLLALWKSGINPKAVISSYIDMNSQDSDSFGEYSSLATDPHVKKLSSGATLAYATEEYTNYGFIALLGLAQRFHVDFLPIVWQEPRGKIGRGGQASINQATLDLQISLAFKQFAQREVDDPFKEIVRELIMLTHPSVQDHRFIVQLEGICWDIVEDKVWPVLVFQKTSLGDLEDFANSDTGRNLSVEQKRGICADIGTAIRDMHANNIIHGDIKPSNVLMWERGGGYTAKVADFGFSTWFRHDNDRILMPISAPWTAPENQGQAFSFSEAKRLDVYSFSMLCFWFLFSVPVPPETATRDRSEKLVEVATRHVHESHYLQSETRDALAELFRSGLCYDAWMRTSNMDHFLRVLAPNREEPRFDITFVDVTPNTEDFQITSSIWGLYKADFRLRSFIVYQLETIVLTSTTPIFKHSLITKAAEQLALCYKIGFGVSRRDDRATRLQIDHAQAEAIEDQVRLIRDSKPEPYSNGGLLDQSHFYGRLNIIEKSQYHREERLLFEAERAYRREIQDATDAFGEDHWLIVVLDSELFRVLEDLDHWEDAEKVAIQIIELSSRIAGKEHPVTLGAQDYLAMVNSHLDRPQKTEELYLAVVAASRRILGDDHPATLSSTANLAIALASQARWPEAEQILKQVLETSSRKLGIEHPHSLGSMSHLASIYRNQERWSEAGELLVRKLALSKRVLGSTHPDTLNSILSLIKVHEAEDDWDMVEELQTQIVGIRKKLFGEEHHSTLRSMSSLMVTFWNQGWWERAEELGTETWRKQENVLGSEHPDTLISLSNLAFALKARNSIERAISLMTTCFETRKEVLGPSHVDTLSSLEVLNAWREEEIACRETGAPGTSGWERLMDDSDD